MASRCVLISEQNQKLRGTLFSQGFCLINTSSPLGGQRLRQCRERLALTYRDVEAASLWIANQHSNNAFLVGISRLADIENEGTTPTIYRLYSLCAIYRVEYATVLQWFGVSLENMTSDAAHFGAQQTRPFDMEAIGDKKLNPSLNFAGNETFRHTDLLQNASRHWGELPMTLTNHLEVRKHRYAFVGASDWSMYPIIPPGSFIQVDERRRKILKGGWESEFDRPIYFVECRDQGYRCGWCSVNQGTLILQPHYSSKDPVLVTSLSQVEIIGQVVGVAMRLDQARKRRIHS